jgi:hypothetical protein
MSWMHVRNQSVCSHSRAIAESVLYSPTHLTRMSLPLVPVLQPGDHCLDGCLDLHTNKQSVQQAGDEEPLFRVRRPHHLRHPLSMHDRYEGRQCYLGVSPQMLYQKPCTQESSCGYTGMHARVRGAHFCQHHPLVPVLQLLRLWLQPPDHQPSCQGLTGACGRNAMVGMHADPEKFQGPCSARIAQQLMCLAFNRLC